MRNITSITKRYIFDLFKNRFNEHYGPYDKPTLVKYKYHGRLSEIEFLNKLYNLSVIPSDDPRFENAEGDIIQHTINNDDWDENWMFEDDRFELLNGDDKVFLDFLCAVFHPENRIENENWYQFLVRVNDLLKVDGYELYKLERISNRSVYSWRPISDREKIMGFFLPFSIRHEYEIENKSIKLPTISNPVREKLLRIFDNNNKRIHTKDETGYVDVTSYIDETLDSIRKHYPPSAFDENNNYSETDDFNRFILRNFPHCVFDALELFSKMVSEKFTNEVNYLLQKNNYGYKLIDGRMELERVIPKIKHPIKEPGLKELMNDALAKYRSNNYKDRKDAVEKLWDALEGLKTYHKGLDKKQSVNKITDSISKSKRSFKELFENEFTTLTSIGNNFRIRHHETNKIDITDQRHYDYFFMRCFTLIEAVLSFIEL